MAYSVLFTFLLLVGIWAILYFFLAHEMAKQDVRLLASRLHTLGNLISAEKNFDRLTHRVENEWVDHGFEHILVRVIDSKGRSIAETPGLSAAELRMMERLMAKGAPEVQRLKNGEFTYQAGYSEVIANGEFYKVAAAIDRSGEVNLLANFRIIFLLLLCVGGLASLWMGRTIVRIALRPIRDVTSIAARVNSESLDKRIDLTTLPVEFHEVAGTMNAMLDRLRESFNRLSMFSADMAHELRTPLNNLLGSMQVALARERSAHEYTGLIESGVEECERLKRIIDSLLFIARCADPRQAIEKTELHLQEELKNIVSFYEVLAEEKKIGLCLKAAQGISIPGERTHFQRCIGNLLSNSIRHSQQGSEIILSAERDENGVCVKVIDFGSGMPQSALERIGERFFRIEPSRSKIYGGTGLGLSIVKSIVEIHGGTMNVESREGAGTTVSLAFPEYQLDSVERVSASQSETEAKSL